MFKRKVDEYLIEWKNNPNKKPLIIKGARQIGKTTSIREFGKTYKSFVEINFKLQPKYKDIFSKGYDVDTLINEMSMKNSKFSFVDHDTLILFDEIQDYPDALTSFKTFSEDGRFDVIASGSLLGISYKSVNSVPVGFKEDYIMYPMDFEEFLWAFGYDDEKIDYVFDFMKKLNPLSKSVFSSLNDLYEKFVLCGGMPETVLIYLNEKNYSNVYKRQENLYKDYSNDITQYVEGLDAAKVLNVYKHISTQLAKENHKFQITKMGHGARSRDYFGCCDWLSDAGIVNIAYNLDSLSFPLNANYNPDNYRIYFADSSLMIASLEKEERENLFSNRAFEIFYGAFYETVIAESLVKQGYNLYFYKNDETNVEFDFVIRVKNEIIPIEVKAKRGKAKSVSTLLSSGEIKHAIKFSLNNIGESDGIITLPHFLSFLLKRFIRESEVFK